MSPINSAIARRRLTVAMVVRDAEDLLSSTLDSVRAIADEIIVVDAGSKDRTPGIATEDGASVFQMEWSDDFSAVRNYGWNRATGDWLLWLDAGEYLAPEEAQSLRRFIDSDADAVKAYMMVVEVPPADGEICGQQIGQVRLVPNYTSLRFAGRVREDLLPAVTSTGLGLQGLPWRIHRTGRDHDPTMKRAKAQRDLQLAELELQQHGRSARSLNTAAEASSILGERTKAKQMFREALALSEPGSTDMLESYYGVLTADDGVPSSLPDQVEICLQALDAFPCDAQLLCAMGSYLQLQEQSELAARAYETAYRFGQVRPDAWHMSNVSEVAAVCSALAWQLDGKIDRAQAVLEHAVAANYVSERIRRLLIQIYILRDLRQKALDQVNMLLGDSVDREALRTAVRGACLASRQQWAKSTTYLETAYAAGCRDPICLRWFAISLLSTGNVNRAEPVLYQWLRREPDNAEALAYLQAIAKQHPLNAVPEDKPAPDGQQFRLDSGQPGFHGRVPHLAPLTAPTLSTGNFVT